ncbi:MAG: type II toxin-antitoxin system VapB family antitoxin, partial [Microthrixaceae bacterium]|nr:type II toxin-antitoxin system VapB family antitoxin [Microthrixaceae bacterium]
MPFGSRNHPAGGQRRAVLYHLPFSARYCLPMGLNIKNEYVHELARRAATATGKTQTGAIEEALERLLAAYGADPQEARRAR